MCKALDYKKFLYDQKKREKFLKAKTQKVIVKEIRFGPQTDQHDYEFKKKHCYNYNHQSNSSDDKNNGKNTNNMHTNNNSGGNNHNRNNNDIS